MFELLQGRAGENFLGLVAILAIFGGPLFVIAWALWLKHRKHERQDEMKREMIERGMSADDIVRVLSAGAPQTDILAGVKPRPPKP